MAALLDGMADCRFVPGYLDARRLVCGAGPVSTAWLAHPTTYAHRPSPLHAYPALPLLEPISTLSEQGRRSWRSVPTIAQTICYSRAPASARAARTSPVAGGTVESAWVRPAPSTIRLYRYTCSRPNTLSNGRTPSCRDAAFPSSRRPLLISCCSFDRKPA